jgi:hypothetical protein
MAVEPDKERKNESNTAKYIPQYRVMKFPERYGATSTKCLFTRMSQVAKKLCTEKSLCHTKEKSSVFGLETAITAVGDPLRWLRETPHLQKLALTSPTSGGRSVGIVHSRTKATELGKEPLFLREPNKTHKYIFEQNVDWLNVNSATSLVKLSNQWNQS